MLVSVCLAAKTCLEISVDISRILQINRRMPSALTHFVVFPIEGISATEARSTGNVIHGRAGQPRLRIIDERPKVVKRLRNKEINYRLLYLSYQYREKELVLLRVGTKRVILLYHVIRF